MLEQLQSALADAFTLETLRRMVKFKLQRDLEDFAVGDKQTVIFELIDAAMREGFVEKLVLGARAFNPGNEKLRDLARQYDLESTRKSTAQLEQIIDATEPSLAPTLFRANILRAEQRVCQVRIKVTGGNVLGSGFLVGPALVMTNYHVMQRVIEGTVPTSAVRMRFDYKATAGKVVESGVEYPLAADWRVDVSEPGPLDEPAADQLDYAIVRLDKVPEPTPEGDRGFYQLSTSPALFPRGAPLFIMQHPDGRSQTLAMDTKAIIGVNVKETRVHYRTNTEPGSSGSPCFTPDFALVAMHQSGDPRFPQLQEPEYNQGIPTHRIAGLIAAGDQGGSRSGAATELGIA